MAEMDGKSGGEIIVTTAARSRDYMRKLGYTAEVVEHRRGSFIRTDLFGVADVLAFGAEPRKIDNELVSNWAERHKLDPKETIETFEEMFKDSTYKGEIILIQAYHKSAGKNHENINKDSPVIRAWISAGGKFENHVWSYTTKKGRKYWKVERREVR